MAAIRFAPALLLALLAGCFTPETPDCTFRCDRSVGNGGHCPDGYSCADDGYCHRNGFTGMCPFDFAVSAPDLATPPDMSVPIDEGAGDAGGDGSTDASLDGGPPDLVGFDMTFIDF
jgi:hypothetical protein